MRNENNQQAEQTEKPKKKRHAGTAKGIFELSDDFKMTEKEFLGLE